MDLYRVITPFLLLGKPHDLEIQTNPAANCDRKQHECSYLPQLSNLLPRQLVAFESHEPARRFSPSGFIDLQSTANVSTTNNSTISKIDISKAT